MLLINMNLQPKTISNTYYPTNCPVLSSSNLYIILSIDYMYLKCYAHFLRKYDINVTLNNYNHSTIIIIFANKLWFMLTLLFCQEPKYNKHFVTIVKESCNLPILWTIHRPQKYCQITLCQHYWRTYTFLHGM